MHYRNKIYYNTVDTTLKISKKALGKPEPLPSLSPLYPIIDNLDFLPGYRDKRFLILGGKGMDKVKKFIEGEKWWLKSK